MNKKKNPIFKMCNIRLTEKQHEEIRRYAFDTNQSVAAVIRDVLEKQKLISPTAELLS